MLPLLSLLLFFIPSLILYILLQSTTTQTHHQNIPLPPGSLGLPLIGHNPSFLYSLWSDTLAHWARRRTLQHGPVSKLSLFGSPTVLMAGPAASKFLFTSDGFVSEIVNPLKRMIGERAVLQLEGGEHRRLRGALLQFLRMDVLKKYVGRVDDEVRFHVDKYWTGNKYVTVEPLAKRFSLDLVCSLVYDIDRGEIRDRLKNNFVDIMTGIWADAIGMPFLNLNKTMRACRSVQATLSKVVNERREAHRQGLRSSKEDVITGLIGMVDRDTGEYVFKDDEIVDVAMVVMLAGYDTTSTLITFMIRRLATDPVTLAAVTEEQEEIAKSKASSDEPLTWDDVAKMKYTWRVAMETLRMIPSLFGGRRKAIRDVEYDGYVIPKGWNVLWLANITQMDETIFPEPEKFDPSRFEKPIPAYCFQSFGAGLHACPGNEFARLETLVLMHYLVTRFKWKLRCRGDVLRRNPTPTPPKGLPIQLEPKY